MMAQSEFYIVRDVYEDVDYNCELGDKIYGVFNTEEKAAECIDLLKNSFEKLLICKNRKLANKSMNYNVLNQ